ncbi:MAG: hypothetical protein FJ388_02330 [Verrucomicrobia bacterium]|nr:hypothetical protein [Verrucomicrobiota bacterium]
MPQQPKLPTSLHEMKPQDYVANLPPNAQAGFKTARDAWKTRQDALAMRSWRGMWSNRLGDPYRTLLDVDYARMLMETKGQFRTQTEEFSTRKGNLMEAKTLLQSARIRAARYPELTELISQQESEINRQLADIESQQSGRR